MVPIFTPTLTKPSLVLRDLTPWSPVPLPLGHSEPSRYCDKEVILPTLPGLSGASDNDSAHDQATADALAKGTAFRHSETTVTPMCNTDRTSAFCGLGNVQGSANELPECSKPQERSGRGTERGQTLPHATGSKPEHVAAPSLAVHTWVKGQPQMPFLRHHPC